MNPRIAHFSTLLAGGSGIASRRLHDGLLKLGTESFLCYGDGNGSNSALIPAYQNNSFFRRNAAAIRTSIGNRMTVPGGFVTGPGWIRPTLLSDLNLHPDVVNLHWVARWLDLPSFLPSLPAGLPVVWSIHDLIPVTGGCHYPKECDHFTKECGNCPQLRRPGAWDSTRWSHRTKRKLYSRTNLHFVGNSEWTTQQIENSSLGRIARSITTIHLGVDPAVYVPVNKSSARQALRIPEGKFAIGFACSDFHEKRKGADLLLKALEDLPAEQIVLMVFGNGKWPSDAGRFETITLGSLGAPRLQSLYYSALDVFVMPSLVETFGLVALEAMACGTPVAAYAAGGLADVVQDGVTGFLEREVGSIQGLHRILREMMDCPEKRQQMGVDARRAVLERFSAELMAKRYLDLYRSLSGDNK